MVIQMKYKIFYDESGYDKSISIKDGIVNIFNSSQSEFFLSAFFLIEDNKLNLVESELNKLILDMKRTLNIDDNKELKSTKLTKILKLKELNKLNENFIEVIKFYKSIFNIITKHSIKINIHYVSKLEMLISNIFKFESYLSIPLDEYKEKNIYSITKYLNTYRPGNFFKHISNPDKSEKSMNVLINFMSNQNKKIESFKNSKTEYDYVKDFIQLVGRNKIKFNKKINPKVKFDFEKIVESLEKFLLTNEILISNVELYIDTNQVLYGALVNKNFNSNQCNSEDNSFIQLVDLFLGFMAQYFKNLESNTEYKEFYDEIQGCKVKRRLLNENVFDIDEQTFEIYKEIGIFFSNNNEFLLNTISLYSDKLYIIYKFFEYFLTFHDFIRYKEELSHVQKFNKYASFDYQKHINNGF